jgi:hypothetical protein
MGISVIGAAASSGGGSSSNFSVNMADYANNTAELSREYPAGSYSITIDPTDSTVDIYFVTSDGSLAGYSNTGSIIATTAFDKVVVLSSQASAKLAFTFGGESATVATSGQIVTVGAYLTSITPGDLATTDDTATIAGGNFASDVEVFFVSGETELAAKNIVRSSSTSLIVTRPDNLSASLDPWTVKVSNPGVPVPSGGNAHLLVGVVDAGAVPAWVTTSPLATALAGNAYSTTIQATDADAGSTITYSITAGALPSGLSLNSATGEISGSPSGGADPVTIQADDGNGNTNSRSFSIPVQMATGGTVTSADGYTIHRFTGSGTFTPLGDITVEYMVLAGGGGGGGFNSGNSGAGGGGAGGYRASIAGEPSGAGSAAESTLALTSSGGGITVTVGAGGSIVTSGDGNNASSSSFGSITAIGGGGGGRSGSAAGNGYNGGSGGGAGSGPYGNSAGQYGVAGLGTANQGRNGGRGGNDQNGENRGGGGGGINDVGDHGQSNDSTKGGDGITTYAMGTSNPVQLGGGGQGGAYSTNLNDMPDTWGGGRGGTSQSNTRIATGGVHYKGGGGGGGTGGVGGINNWGFNGGNGVVIVRYLA